MTFKPEDHLRELKGQKYLDCAWRVVWVREEHPDALIDTEVVYWDHEKQEIMVRAVVVLPKTGARATGHCVGTLAEFKFGYVEKCETQAVGRALALLGYGTAFAGQDLDEGERVADSPTAARNGGGAGASAPPVSAQTQAAVKPATPATRAAGGTVTAPVPVPAADSHATLRAEVAGLLASDTEAATKLPKTADTMTGQELEKTRTWLHSRAAEARAVAVAQQEQGDPAPEPVPSDEQATLRAEVVALLAEDGPALALLQQQGKPLPPEQDAATLVKTKTWLLQRQKHQRPLAVRLGEDIARAGTEEEVKRAVADAWQGQARKDVNAAEYKRLCQAAEARKAELSAPLLAGGQGRAQVAS